MKNKMLDGFLAISGVMLWILYAAAHIVAAIAIFKIAKLWAFLICLFVPGIGDVMSFFFLFHAKFWWPFILYAIAIAWSIAAQFIANKADSVMHK